MQLTDKQKQSIRIIRDALLDGQVGEGLLSLDYSRRLTLAIERFDSHATITVSDGEAEVSLPGPDPNIQKVTIEQDRIGVSFALGTIWLDIDGPDRLDEETGAA